jgi:hypothetical protein
MHQGQLVFSQLMRHLPLTTFRRCVARYAGEHKVKSFSCLDQYLCMAFAQLTYRESLRDIESSLRAQAAKLYHLGIRGNVSRNTLANANATRDWRIYASFAERLIGIARCCPQILSHAPTDERVLVMQPAKDRFGADGVRFRAAVTRTGFSEVEDTWWWIRNTRAQRHVRTSGIVVSNPGFQNGPQMRFGNGDQPIQALAPNRADDSFTDRIRFRAARRRFQHLNAKSVHRFVELLGKDAIAIMQ